ncbi:hypothetical protein D3C72_2496100 [compost metagenome]
MVVEASGESAFGVFVHAEGTNLEFYDLLVRGDDRSVKALVAIWLWNSDIISNA